MNRTVGSYRILEQLGEGAMGAVYRAVDIHLDREVALKSVRREVASQPEFLERFREEAKIQARLDSPHIVRVYQFLREGDEFFMVMEFVQGRSLSSVLAEKGRLAPEQAVSIIMQALEGLDYAHRRNVVHRDIKPANIMLNDEGVVKVADFGIARVLGSSRQRLTQVGGVVGTLEYMSPETLVGQDATAASDMYSCGIVAYQLLTGQLPFKHPNDWTLVEMHRNSAPPPLRGLVPDIPQPLEAAVLRALAKKPQDRFRSAGEMARVFGAWLQSVGGSPRSEPGLWDKLRPLASPQTPGVGGMSEPAASGASRYPQSNISEISRRVEELISRHDWQQAHSELERHMSGYPGNTRLLELRDRISREQRYYEEGLQVALKEAQNLLQGGIPELAKTAIEASLLRYPNHPDLLGLLDRAKQAMSERAAGSGEVKKVAAEVAALLERQQFQDAVRYIVDAVGRLPNHPELATLLSRTVQAEKEHAKLQAIDACRQRVHSFQESENWEAAFQAIDQALSQFPNDPELIGLRAATERERAIQLREKEIRARLHQAEALREANQLDAAEQALVETLHQYPEDASVTEMLAGIRAEKEQARRRAVAAQAIETARALREATDWNRALETIGAALREAPGDAQLEKFRAETERLRDQFAAQLQAAIENGQALLKSRRFEDALMVLSEESQRYPNDPTIRKLLLEAQQSLAAERRERQLQQIDAKASDLLSRGAFEEAEQILLDAIPQFPDDARLTRSLSAAIQGRRDKEKKKAVGECLERARLQEAQGGLEAAIQEIEAGLSRYSSEPVLEQRKRELSGILTERRRGALLAALRPKVDGYLKAHDYEAALAEVAAALGTYPGDADFATLETEVRNAKRLYEQQIAESEAARRVADLENRKEFEAASSLLDEALAGYPASTRLAALRDSFHRRWQAAVRAEKIQSAELGIRSLLDRSEWRSALDLCGSAASEFPEHPAFRALREQAENALRQAAEDEARNAIQQALAARRWQEAEAAAADFERQHGSGTFSSGLRNQIASARQARRKQVDKALADARTRINRREFAAAIELLEALHADEAERGFLQPLLESAQTGLEQQRIEQALKKLQESVTAALGRGDLAAAKQALAEASAGFGSHSGYQDLEAKVRREEAIASALRAASAHRAERDWTKALDALDRAARDWGQDARIGELAARVRQEQRTHQDAVEAVLAEVRALSDASEFEQALERLTAALHKMPEEPALKQALSETQQRLPAFRRAAKLHSIEAAAESLISSKQWESAESILQEALLDLPGEGRLIELLRSTQAELQRARAIQACAADVEARLAGGELAAAEQILAEGQRQFPEDETLRGLKGRLAESRRAARDRAIQAAVAHAQTDIAAQRLEEARRSLTAALQAHGEDSRLRETIAAVDAAEQRKAAEEIAEVQQLLASAGPEAALKRLNELGPAARLHPDFKALREKCQRELKKSQAAARTRATMVLPMPARPASPPASKKPADIDTPPGDVKDTKPELAPRPAAEQPPVALPAARPLPWKLIGGGIAALLVLGIAILSLTRKPAVTLISLGVRSDPPGASVRVGDQSCTTPSCNISLPPGNYQLDAQLNGYEPVRRTITLSAGKAAEPVDLTLQPAAPPPTAGANTATGTLVVQSGIDNALVYIDGAPRGRTDASGNYTLPLEAANHQVRVEKSGYGKPPEQPVQIAAGSSKTLRFRMVAESARLELRGAPPGVEVRADGTLLGRTSGAGPFSVSVPAGTQALQFTQGNSSRQVAQRFEGGQTVTLNWTSVAPSAPAAAVAPKQADPAEQDWERVRGTQDPAQLQSYIDRYPNGPHAGEARTLEDNLTWSRSNQNDAASLRAYVSRFPRGAHAAEASSRLAELAWNAVDKKSEQQLRDFIAQNGDNPHRTDAQRLLDQLRADQTKQLAAKQLVEDQRQQAAAGERLTADRQSILQALKQVEAAYNSKSIEQLGAIFPSMSSNSSIRNLFRSGNVTITLKLAAQGDPQISGDTATIRVTRTLTQTYRNGPSPPTNPDSPTVTLRRSGQGWIILSIM